MLCVEEEKDIFWRTHSIEEIESKYYDILFAILRVENNAIKQDIQQGIDKIKKCFAFKPYIEYESQQFSYTENDEYYSDYYTDSLL